MRRRLPPPYRAWMRDDVEGFWFPLRMNLALPMVAMPVLWAMHSPRPFDRWGMGGLGLLLAVITVLAWNTARSTRRRLYRVPPRPAVLAMRPGDECGPATR